MMYDIVKKVVKKDSSNWEGLIVKDEEDKQYITNGVYLWIPTRDRLNKLQEVDRVNIAEIKRKFNYFYPYDSLVWIDRR